MKALMILLIPALFYFLQGCTKSAETFSSKAGGSGKNGSMSRMITVGNYLYAVDDQSLITLNAANPASMQITDRTKLGTQIQTVFHYNGQLFIGSANTMFVYDITTTPQKPTQVNSFTYPVLLESRDPIIAFDSVIYSTVTSGAGGGVLRVFNNKNITSPALINTLSLQQPRGMDRSDSVLYLCNGKSGLYLLNIKQPFFPTFIKAIDENNTLNGGSSGANDYYDAIAISPLLFCYTKGTLLNYNISNPANPVFLNKTN